MRENDRNTPPVSSQAYNFGRGDLKVGNYPEHPPSLKKEADSKGKEGRDRRSEKPLPHAGNAPDTGALNAVQERGQPLSTSRCSVQSLGSRDPDKPHRERSKSPAKSRRTKDEPPHSTIVDLNDTRPEHDHTSGRSRRAGDLQDASRSEGKKSAPAPPVMDPRSAQGDSSMETKTDEFSESDSDTEMDYEEARQHQDPDTITIQEATDRAIAIELQEEEDAESKAKARALQHQKRLEHSDVESDTPMPDAHHRRPEPPVTAAGRLWSAVVGTSSSNYATKEEKYRAKSQDLERELKQMHKELVRCQQALEREQHHHRQTYHQARELERAYTDSQRHIHFLQQEVHGQRNELANIKQQLSDAVNLSEVRGKELKGAQVFLTKADSLSTSDVVQKVATLNEEIFQAACLLGETLAYEVYEEGVDRIEVRRKAIEQGHESAKELLGAHLTSILAEESLKPPQQPNNPLLVQIVIQSALTAWCARICDMWKPGPRSRDRDTSRIIADIYEDIRSNEDQAVAGRWRSLTLSHIKYSTSEWTQYLLRNVQSIMHVAGWAVPSQTEIDQFEKRLHSIFKIVQDVRKATGEDVTSADLAVMVVEHERAFDPATMEDAYGDERAAVKSGGGKGAVEANPEKVVATSGMGLVKVMVKKGQAEVGKVLEVLSQPKVVLEKTVREAIEPPPPPKSRRRKGGESGGGGGGGGGVGLVGLFTGSG
ncbi:hypothetical protein CC1G_04583 [Coprinopsis cinerea okayama7|uniref:Uncharacterized protein n=1 Tax=Coprinopsis cinerea (strain Okayama-7 / 130 / ATCC MYA-4618 / FGSC 9003) TaxID=240176 RepID=A8N505_COPC7|nr:hypothetical protein CC1G_04583 [Coprinopsis cinerea okayama7\|eukprot:XP_001829894.2 hypothetical protein CC1G_04583 [Coprinopsis cinerea okayama7\